MRLPKIIWKQATSPALMTEPLTAAVHNCLTVFANVHLIHDSFAPPHSPSQIATQSVQLFLQGRCHILPIVYIVLPISPHCYPRTDQQNEHRNWPARTCCIRYMCDVANNKQTFHGPNSRVSWHSLLPTWQFCCSVVLQTACHWWC